MAFLHQRDFCLLFQAVDSRHKYLQELHYFFPPMILRYATLHFATGWVVKDGRGDS